MKRRKYKNLNLENGKYFQIKESNWWHYNEEPLVHILYIPLGHKAIPNTKMHGIYGPKFQLDAKPINDYILIEMR